jgi:hypothetical protein
MVITVILAVTVAASLWKVRRNPDIRAHAGSLRGRREERRDSAG